MGDAGLHHLLADSEVYAPCTVDQMLTGKQFNQAVHGLTLAYEALSELCLNVFMKWCHTNGHLPNIPTKLWDQLIAVQQAIKEQHPETLKLVTELESVITNHLDKLMPAFNHDGCQSSQMFSFWHSFLNAVQILLSNIQSERAGDWDLSIVKAR